MGLARILMRLRQTPQKSKLPVGETVERSDEAALHKSREEIVHLVEITEYRRWMVEGGGPIARCGFNCEGREPGFESGPICLVCIDLRNGSV